MGWLALSTGADVARKTPESEVLPREVWRLAWPAITHMLLVTLVLLVDRMILGHYSSSALGSLQISAILFWTLYSIFTAFSSGTLAVVARALGESDPKAAGRAATVSLGFAAALGVVVTAAILGSLDFLLPRVFPDAGAEVRRDASAYLAIVLPCLPAGFLEASAAAALQAAGDTKTPLRAGVVANLLNLAISCTLVFGLFGCPALGVRGAAIGAATAMVTQALLLLVALVSRKSPLVLSLRDLELGETFRRLMRVSVPAYLEKLVYNSGYLVFTIIVARLGEAAMAANQAMISIEGICFLTAEGFAVAAASLVARKLGAGKKNDATEVAAIATRLSIGLLTTCGLAFALMPRLLMRAFSADAEIIDTGASALIVAAMAQPFMAYAIVIRMSLRGAGSTKAVLLINLIGTFFVRLPLAYLAITRWHSGLTGIWIASTADWIVQAGLALAVFRHGAWRNQRV